MLATTLVGDQRHLGLAGRAAGQVENGGVVRGDAAAYAGEQCGVARQGVAAEPAQRLESDRFFGFAGEQDPMRDLRIAQRFERLRVFHEDGARTGGFDRTYQVRGRVARIHRGGDRAVGDDAQIGQVELEPGFGVERDDVAFADAERAQTGGDLFGGTPVLVPGIDGVGAVGRGLA